MFRFTEQDVYLRGKAHRYKIVDHPGGAAILAVREENVLLVEQFRPAVQMSLLEVPAGVIDPGEQPQQTARRELAEETGYRAKTWASLGRVLPSPGYTSETIHLFLAKDLTMGSTHFDEAEDLQSHWLPLTEVLEMIESGKIVDGKTVVMIYKYLRRDTI